MALINSRKHTFKNYAKRQDRQSPIWSPFTISGQEREWGIFFQPQSPHGAILSSNKIQNGDILVPDNTGPLKVERETDSE